MSLLRPGVIKQHKTQTHEIFDIMDVTMGTQQDYVLTLTVLVTTIDAQWEGMGYVGSPRYEALLPPCPTIRV